MKTIKLILAVVCFTIISSSLNAQTSGSNSYFDFYKPNETAIYGMKGYRKDNTFYLFITETFKLCDAIDKYDTFKFDEDLKDYIEANYNNLIRGARDGGLVPTLP